MDIVLSAAEYGNFSGVLSDSIGSELTLEPVNVAGSEAGPRKAVVSGQGNFEFRHIPVGIYKLEIQPEGINETIQIEKGENLFGGLEQDSSPDQPLAGGQAENGNSYKDIEETEPNNDFLNANEVTSSANIRGKIYNSGDEDYFKLTIDAPLLLTVAVKNVEEGFRPYIIVYDIAGKWLGSTASLSGKELEYALELAKAGTYYLQLKDRYNSFSSQQEYLLKLDSVSGSDQYEPNSDFNSAKTIVFRKEIISTMFPNGDEDYFAIDMTGKGEFYMRLDDVPEGLRPSVKLYDHSGKLVAQKGGSSGEKITLQAEIEEPGGYYILIKDWYSNFSSMETYSFKAFLVNTLDEYEPNNAKGEAVPLESGRSCFGTIAVKGDNDFYRLSIPDSGAVIVNLTDVPPNIRPYIKLYEETKNNWVNSAAGSDGEDLTMEFNTDAPSNYFIQLQDKYNSESSFSRYRLYFIFIPDDEYLPDSIEIFHETKELASITNKKEVRLEIPGIENTGKFYLQVALNSSDPQKNSQAIERFYVGNSIPGPVLSPQIEALCLDSDTIYNAGDIASFRFKAINKGAAGGMCEIRFKFRDLFNQAWSGFLEAGEESDIEFDFLIPVDLEEGEYEAEYLFGGVKHPVSFSVLGIKLESETSFQGDIFTVNLTNAGSMADADLYIEVSCGEFKEARNFVLRDKIELIFEIQETDGQDKIYYGIYFSSGKALYLDSFLLGGEEEPEASLKVVRAECDKDKYVDGDIVNIEWRLVSREISSARLTADLISPDSGSIKIIDEDIDLTEGMNMFEKEIKPDLKIPGLYRIVYRFICDDSAEVQASIFLEAGEEVRLDLHIAKGEYAQDEEIDFTVRCFTSYEIKGKLKVFLDEKPSKTMNIDLEGYEEFVFDVKENKSGEHVAYVSLLYGDKTVNSGREKFKIVERSEPNHSPVLFTIGEKMVLIGEESEFSIEATDIDGDVIRYSVKGLPDGALFEDRRFYWKSGVNQTGEYFVTFTASDGKDAAVEIVKITVKNPVIMPEQPLADPVSGIAPLEVYFNSDSIAKANIVKYEWDFDGKGVYDFKSAESGNVMFVYTGKGNFPAELRVTDKYGDTDIHTVSINVKHNSDAPKVYIDAVPVKDIASCKVHFSGIVDSQADICKCEWDFNGDGVYDADSSVSTEVVKTYGTPGVYNVEFKVTNSIGLSDSEIVTIEALDPLVLNVEPMISVDSGDVPIEINFDASISSEKKIQKYQWDFQGDGIYDFTSTDSAVARYVYHEPGVYMPNLRVVDEKNVSAEAIKEIRLTLYDIDNIETGKIKFKPKKGKAPFRVNFTFLADFEIQAADYFWDFDGDGICDTVTDTPESEYTYYDSGVYTVEVKVVASEGIIASHKDILYVMNGKRDNNDTNNSLVLSERKKVLRNKSDKIELSDKTSLTLPAGILESDDVVNIDKLEEGQVSKRLVVAENIISAGEYREYKFDVHKEGFDKEMTIAIPYADEDNDGIVDGRNIDELTLDAYWFNEDSQDWKMLSDVLIFPQENLVTIKTNHFSLFGIAGEKVKEVDGTDSENSIGESDNEDGTNCFIGTAAFDTPAAKEVRILCAFRDRYLLRSESGRQFVALYYKFSPPIARFIKQKPLIKFLIRVHIKFIAHIMTAVL
ncbi:MAG: PKD domain-containing protein [Candidatus Omnitrophota bacterium]